MPELLVGLPKFKITLILAVTLTGAGLQISSANAAQSQSLFGTMGLTGSVKSAKSASGFVTGLKPPIFVDSTTGAVVAPPTSAAKSPLTVPSTTPTGKLGLTSGTPSSSGPGGAVEAITNAAAGIMGGAVTVGARGPQGIQGLQGLAGPPEGPTGPARTSGRPRGPAGGPSGTTLVCPSGPTGLIGSSGATEPIEVTVPMGPTGPTGPTCSVAAVLSGAGAPSTAIGGVGDLYFDTTNSLIYGPKVNGVGGAWPFGTSSYLGANVSAVYAPLASPTFTGTVPLPNSQALTTLVITGALSVAGARTYDLDGIVF